MTESAVAVSFLTDGGQPAERTATELTEFFQAAGKSLDIAIYDLHLDGPPAELVSQAVKAAAQRGVAIRLLYNVDFPNPIPVPPPPDPDTASSRPWVCPTGRSRVSPR